MTSSVDTIAGTIAGTIATYSYYSWYYDRYPGNIADTQGKSESDGEDTVGRDCLRDWFRMTSALEYLPQSNLRQVHLMR